MNFDWTGEQKQVRDRLNAALKGDLGAIGELERADIEGNRQLLLGFLSRMADTGYLGLGQVADAHIDIMTLVAARELLAQWSGSLFLAVEASSRLFGTLAAASDQEDLHRQVLTPLRQGKSIGAVGMTEDRDASDPADTGRTVAIADGDGYLVTGRKPFVTNGPIADWIAVTADLDAQVAVFFLPCGHPGLAIGPPIPTLGFDGLTVSSVELTEARVSPPFVLGPLPDQGLLDLLRLREDLALAQLSVGLMQSTFDAARFHAKKHKRGGKPILHYQEIGFKLAELLTLLQTAQLLTYRAAWMWSYQAEQAPTLVRCAKVFAAEAAQTVAAAALQIGGGRSYLADHPLTRFYRESGYPGLAGTTTERCRMAIADDMIKQHPV
ncbi:MAG: acyl-CoA dehydrogenase [Bradymonadales bacterium]|nr:acyl-CoA dehydrogenase [Bradymonadales bacterium]